MFLHSAWIFHPEARVAPINSTEPRHFNLLRSARLHTGADWRMQASCRFSSLCQDSYLSQSCQRCDWQPVRGSRTPPFSLCLLETPRVEPSTRLRESRHDVWAGVPRPGDISCGWYRDIFRDWMHVVSHDPSKEICGNGRECHRANVNNTARLRRGGQLWCGAWFRVMSKCLWNKNTNIY